MNPVSELNPSIRYTLLQVFSKFGKVTKLDFLFHKTGLLKGKPRGYAFVEYGNKDVSTFIHLRSLLFGRREKRGYWLIDTDSFRDIFRTLSRLWRWLMRSHYEVANSLWHSRTRHLWTNIMDREVSLRRKVGKRWWTLAVRLRWVCSRRDWLHVTKGEFPFYYTIYLLSRAHFSWPVLQKNKG